MHEEESLADRVTRLEAKNEARGIVIAALVLVALLAVALHSSGVLKLDLAANG